MMAFSIDIGCHYYNMSVMLKITNLLTYF